MKEEVSMIRIPKISPSAWVLAVAALGLMHAASAFALDADNTTKTETFDVEPDWIGFQNHAGANDFGFSETNNLGSPSMLGEAGGNLGRDIRAWYADDVGELDPSTDMLTMSGRMWVHIEGNNDTEAHLGWFDKDGLGGANTPSHYMGFRLINDPPYEVRVLWQTASNQNGQTDVDAFEFGINDSVPFDFEFTYNPSGFNNQGQISASINGGSPVIVNLPFGVKDNFANFDRFGLIGGNIAGQNRYVEVYVDDLTYTLNKSAAATLGDFNQDTMVDDVDFGIMKDNWLTSGRTKNTFGEVTGDGIVDLKDFKLFKESLYQGGSGSLILAVPEPAALTLLGLATPFALSWRSRREDRCRRSTS